MKYQHFQDFDAFVSAVRDVNSTMMIENPMRFSWDITHITLSEIHIQIGREGSGNITEGHSRSDGYILFIPLNHAGAHAANGKALDKNSFAILEPECDFCVRCNTEHDWCSIFIPTHKLAYGNDLLEPSLGSEKIKCRVNRPNSQLMDRLRALVGPILTTATNNSEFESSPAATYAAAELLKVASLVVGQRQAGQPKQEGRPKLSREEIIRRSKDLLEERNGKSILVGELAAAAGVCERTLRTAFKEYFGVGPVRYLQLRQLHQVERALRVADPEEVSVSNVLLQYGVWEFSRFASRYRRLFGELPSETLRRKRGSVISR